VLTVGDDRIRDIDIPSSDTVLIPLESLMPALHYPRLGGIDNDHVRVLAESSMPLPPILVQRSMRVIDGLHRVYATRLRGKSHIEAVVLDESDTYAYVRSLTANIAHGLPLTLRDRKAAAQRLLRIYPDKSDRAVARLVGLSGKTIGALRQSLDDLPQPAARMGQDGRVRPADSTERRRLAAKIMAEHPGTSLREIAGVTGLSASTVSTIRRHLRSSGSTGTAVERRSHPERVDIIGPDPDPHQTLSDLMRDPSLRYTDVGRTLLRWLHRHPVIDGQSWQDLISAIPPHCLPAMVRLSRRFANYWQEFAQHAEELMMSDTD